MEDLFKRLLDYYQINEDDYRLLTMDVTPDNFYEGHSFKDMDKCVEVVKTAIKENKKIFIYGDYDADGIMSVSILVKMFSYLNYPVSYHIPNRYLDGYGLTLKRAEEIVESGYDLLITVDNGITAFEGIEYAKSHGLKVLIFDHHQPDTILPNADYILHPLVSEFGDVATSAGFVTMMFSMNYLGRLDHYLCTLAAISLVSDMMPLKSYNRNLLRLAINWYKEESFLSIDLLKEKEAFNETGIGMKIAPKINALGRMIETDEINKIVEESFYYTAGKIRGIPVSIGGTKWQPDLPIESVIKEDLNRISGMEADEVDKAIEYLLYTMKKQIFIDGNKRTAVIFSNHYLISKGKGIIVIPAEKTEEFKSLLIPFYEGKDNEKIRAFIKEKCYMKI